MVWNAKVTEVTLADAGIERVYLISLQYYEWQCEQHFIPCNCIKRTNKKPLLMMKFL